MQSLVGYMVNNNVLWQDDERRQRHRVRVNVGSYLSIGELMLIAIKVGLESATTQKSRVLYILYLLARHRTPFIYIYWRIHGHL